MEERRLVPPPPRCGVERGGGGTVCKMQLRRYVRQTCGASATAWTRYGHGKGRATCLGVCCLVYSFWWPPSASTASGGRLRLVLPLELLGFGYLQRGTCA